MSKLYVCNTASDYISEVDIITLKERKINLTKYANRIGPHGICSYNDNLIVANNYSNSITKIDIMHNDTEDFFIGVHLNDVRVYKDTAYIICGETNSLITFDLINNRVMEYIPTGIYPHSIEICEELALAVITNMLSENIILLDCISNEVVGNIKVGHYPTKSIFTPERKGILICSSNMGADKPGGIKLLDLESLTVVGEVMVGRSPVDICCDQYGYSYITNFNDGSISIVNYNSMKELYKIFIGGMPRGIVKNNYDLFIGDNYNNLLINYKLSSKEIKIIPVGKEPNGMIIN